MTERILGSKRSQGARFPTTESGITYMELLAVCVVIGMLIVIIVPRIDLSLRAARRHATAAQFATAHDMARAAAARYGRVAEFHIDAANGDELLASVTEGTGVAIRALPGEEEARLTFLACRRWFGRSLCCLATGFCLRAMGR